jgi:2-amino-4-hydroxy-6-hydroxymethyldihydropteridine diphosphokinase
MLLSTKTKCYFKFSLKNINGYGIIWEIVLVVDNIAYLGEYEIMSLSYIGLGSNIGDKADNIRKALEILDQFDGSKVVKVSSFYETEPVGYEDQDWFVNAVAQIETDLSPEQLLILFKKVENLIGRKDRIRWGPREIDLDLLFYDQMIINNPDLIVPHPRLHERAFVLAPLAEIAPDFVHPIIKKTIAELLLELQSQKVVKQA